MKKLFFVFAMAGSMYAAAQSQMIASRLSEDSVVVQPSSEVCDSTQLCATDTACCDTTACANGSSAANGEADNDTRIWIGIGGIIALLTAYMMYRIRKNNRINQQ